MAKRIWTVTNAKAHFSALVEQARAEGPRSITRTGRIVAVMTAATGKLPAAARQGTLADFFAASPLRGSGLVLRRRKGSPPC